jgi:hypothetical protein
MRNVMIGAALTCLAGLGPMALADDSGSSAKPDYSTGRTQTPETSGQKQPQGWTGPVDTGTGGAPAESPQGQSPPGMQPAPEGSSKTTVAPDKGN